MTKEKKLLIDFINWLRKDYEVEDVYEMYADEFLQDIAKTNSDQPDVIKSVCSNCGHKLEEHTIAAKLCPNKFSHYKQTVL